MFKNKKTSLFKFKYYIILLFNFCYAQIRKELDAFCMEVKF